MNPGRFNLLIMLVSFLIGFSSAELIKRNYTVQGLSLTLGWGCVVMLLLKDG